MSGVPKWFRYMIVQLKGMKTENVAYIGYTTLPYYLCKASILIFGKLPWRALLASEFVREFNFRVKIT